MACAISGRCGGVRSGNMRSQRASGKVQKANVDAGSALTARGRLRRIGTLLRFLPFAFYLLPVVFPHAQSGRQTTPPPKPQLPSQGQPRKPSPDSRPRRAAEDSQDERPVKLSADLVTVITSVTDPSGNQINDLSQKDFDLFED